jgi:hypoxanthine phosphoribosyltransferase
LELIENIKSSLKVLISTNEISERISELAEKINSDFKNKKLTFVIVLKGGVFFGIDLLKKINLIFDIDFIEISSYDDAFTSSGKINLVKDLRNPIENKNLVIIEDIVDTGLSLKFLIEHFKKYNPSSIKTCVLLDKHENRKENIDLDYVGFVIPAKFVIGYGMDYKNYFRNLDYVGYLELEN